MPAMMGKQKAQEKLLRNLADSFAQVQREYHLPVGVPLLFMHTACIEHGLACITWAELGQF